MKESQTDWLTSPVGNTHAVSTHKRYLKNNRALWSPFQKAEYLTGPKKFRECKEQNNLENARIQEKAVHSSALHGSDPHRNRVSEQQPNQAAFPLRPQAPSLQNDSRSPSGPARYTVYNSCCKDPGILRERVPFFPCGRELRNMHKAHSIIGLKVSPVCSDHPA